ncbi:MAG: hypothetical protein HY438_03020 [DPANN group archaeon]|nr:hypothetical protein [DPANN group archaeon]
MEKLSMPKATVPQMLVDDLAAVLEVATRDIGGLNCRLLTSTEYVYDNGKPTRIHTVGDGVGEILATDGLKLVFKLSRTNPDELGVAVYDGVQFVLPKEELTPSEEKTYLDAIAACVARISYRGAEYRRSQQGSTT